MPAEGPTGLAQDTIRRLTLFTRRRTNPRLLQFHSAPRRMVSPTFDTFQEGTTCHSGLPRVRGLAAPPMRFSRNAGVLLKLLLPRLHQRRLPERQPRPLRRPVALA